MQARELEDTAAAESRRLQQRRMSHTGNAPSPSVDPLAPMITWVSDASSASVHAAMLNRVTGMQSSRAGNALLQLQRQYGNRYVQRVLALVRQADDERQAAPEVEKAIERARGGGQALDRGVRIQMESAFGADFSGVRVHTDAGADTLNRALNARAFSIGQDIFFGHGEYNAGSANGRELLAHELTHVVQLGLRKVAGNQASGSMSISKPSDPLELEAEKVAQAVTGRRALGHIRNSLQTPMSLMMIHRRQEWIATPWWGSAPEFTSDSDVWFDPNAELWTGEPIRVVAISVFPTGRATSFQAALRSNGVIRVVVRMGWFQDNVVFNYSGRASVVLDVPFAVSAQGEVDWRTPSQNSDSGGDAAELVTPVQVATQRTDTGGYIVVSPIIRSEGAVTATSSVGAQEVVGGSLGGEETTSRTQSWQRSFRVDLIVPRPQVPAPGVTSTYTADAHFAVGEHRLLEGGERHIVGWYEGLPADVRRNVEAGTTQIVLRGYASTTQPGPENLDLSKRRVQRAREVLSGRVGSNARFQEFYFGEYRARTPDQVETIEERRVEMEVIVQRP
jgi:hypothetical protein